MNNFVSFGLFFGLASLIGHGNAIAQRAGWDIAQITPDSSVGTTVTPNVEIKGVGSDRIDGGTIRGSNLFHSFSEFNINTGRGVYFSNPQDVSNIFSRITGNNPSNINGILGVLGNANLFLLNPNGIIFGPNARLDLNGSFFGTTANSIRFADGTQFSATNPQAGSLLTVSVPIGLGFGSNSGAIKLQGTGHNLSFDTTFPVAFPPFKREVNATGLTVQPGRTLALVGGDVVLEGGQLVAERARIDLGSVGLGQVSLTATSSGFALGYEGVSSFQDIQLSRSALVDASGANGGGIHLVGRRVILTEGSAALIQNPEAATAGEIAVNASESVELIGTTADGKVRSSLNTESTGSGSGGNIRVSTGKLTLIDGGQIISRTFRTGSSGSITVDASESVEAIGSSPLNSRFFSSIQAIASAGSFGQAGNLSISTERLTILGGGIIFAASFGAGSGGNLIVKASEVVEAIGKDPIFGSPSDLNAGSFRAGDAGNITIDTTRLVVRDGARVSASTVGSGNAGTITVNASQLVEVSGNSSIESSVNSTTLIENILGFRDRPSGKAGGVTINTNRFNVLEGGRVTVRNIGLANGGRLQVNAGSVLLDTEGSLTASTASGEGGNIILQANALQLRRNSNITATAGGTGNGGNLTINTNTLVALENSDITANAFQGQGGNIAIATAGIFPSTDSNITASSQFGLSGTINVSVLNFNQQNVVAPPPSNFVSPDQVVANSCLARQGNSQGTLAIAGNGGLPETPETRTIPYQVVQVGSVQTQATQSSFERSRSVPSGGSQAPTPSWKFGDPIVEATEFSVNAQGQVVLTAKGYSATGANAHPQPIPCEPNLFK
jgi:filamentous hemagglutinin family protein